MLQCAAVPVALIAWAAPQVAGIARPTQAGPTQAGPTQAGPTQAGTGELRRSRTREVRG